LRRFADLNELKVKINFLDMSKDIRLSRVRRRNIEKGATFEFEVSKENFDFVESCFKKPSEKEMA
jgi:hypothetical protein